MLNDVGWRKTEEGKDFRANLPEVERAKCLKRERNKNSISMRRRAGAEHQATLTGTKLRVWCPWAPSSTPNPWPALGACPPRPGPPCRPLTTAPLCRRSRRVVTCKRVAHTPQKQATVWQISMARRAGVHQHLARVVRRQDAPLQRPCTHPAADNSLTMLQPPSPPPLRERAPPRGAKDVGVALCGAVLRRAPSLRQHVQCKPHPFFSA